MNKYKLLIIICFLIITFCLPKVTATVNNLSLLGKTIVLDAGHGGVDDGAKNNYIVEKNLNLVLVKKLEKELTSKGATVYLTRKDEKDLSTTTVNRKRQDLYNRAKFINDLSPDILSEGHQKELTAYKGVMVSKSHAERDMFKFSSITCMERPSSILH